MTIETERRVLIFRLSSLGDLVMATAALGSRSLAGSRIDWVTAEEFAPLLAGHPSIHRLWAFRRKSGLGAWIRLCRELESQGYDEVIDLHRTLRTRVARVVFAWRALFAGGKRARRGRAASWRTVSKSRFRLYGFYLLKKLWPPGLRPDPWVRRFARVAGGSGEERPNLAHLAASQGLPAELKERRPYYCVMPSSLWDGKKWPVERFVELVRELAPLHPVILGTGGDAESLRLVKLLQGAGLAHTSGVGAWPLPVAARVLSSAEFYVGNDTGLAHLAEAVGTRAFILFGPTTPEMGFGPWRESSRSIGSALWCRPCGKDVRNCFRVSDRYRCMREIESGEVAREIRDRKPAAGVEDRR